MSTPFQAALSAYVDAHLTYNETWDKDGEGSGEATDVAARVLAQAGDVLERESRQVTREESQRTFNEEEDARGVAVLTKVPLCAVRMPAKPIPALRRGGVDNGVRAAHGGACVR